MNYFLKLLGIITIILGIVLGLYVGFWVMFVGGILAITNGISMHNITTSLIAVNSLKILFANFIGIIIIRATFMLGMNLIEKMEK